MRRSTKVVTPATVSTKTNTTIAAEDQHRGQVEYPDRNASGV